MIKTCLEKLDLFDGAKANAGVKLKINTKERCDIRYWMNDQDIAAAAYLFQCNIYVFTQLKAWQGYHPQTFINGRMLPGQNFDSNINNAKFRKSLKKTSGVSKHLNKKNCHLSYKKNFRFYKNRFLEFDATQSWKN